VQSGQKPLTSQEVCRACQEHQAHGHGHGHGRTHDHRTQGAAITAVNLRYICDPFATNASAREGAYEPRRSGSAYTCRRLSVEATQGRYVAHSHRCEPRRGGRRRGDGGSQTPDCQSHAGEAAFVCSLAVTVTPRRIALCVRITSSKYT